MSSADTPKPATASSRGSRLTTVILVALILGIAAGYVAHEFFAESSPRFAETVALLPTAFLRLVRMIIAPLVSLTLGLVLVDLLEPGKAMQLALPAGDASTGLKPGGLSLDDFIAHTIPTSVIDAMARNEILQIVVFSVFFGVAMTALGPRTAMVLDGLEGVSLIMLRVTGYVMLFAPLAVFGALASTVAQEGLGVIKLYGIFVGEFY